jgi:hypothetical protein
MLAIAAQLNSAMNHPNQFLYANSKKAMQPEAASLLIETLALRPGYLRTKPYKGEVCRPALEA